MAGGPDKDGNGGELLKALLANCSRRLASSLGTFSGVAGYGSCVGQGGGGERHCWTADIVAGVCVGIGRGNCKGKILSSMQPCLLKYKRSTLVQKNKGCTVACFSISNLTGSQPVQVSMEPPTAVTRLVQGRS